MNEHISREFKLVVAEGFTSIKHNQSGESIFIGGIGGSLIEFKNYDDQDPFIWEASDDVICLACKNKRLVVGTEDHKVILFDLNTVQEDRENSAKLLTKFECPVRCLSLDASGTYVAAGSDDSTIKILDLNNKENITELSGHQNSIRSLAYDPLGEFLLSSSCDGTLRVWNLRKSGCLVVSLDILEKISDPELAIDVGTVEWHPEGGKFAVPSKNEIHVYQRDAWKLLYKLHSTAGHSKAVSVIKWSFDGAYLASASVDGHILIWDQKTCEPICSCNRSVNYRVTDFDWHPSGRSIAIASYKGGWSVWEGVVPAKSLLLSSHHSKEDLKKRPSPFSVPNGLPPTTSRRYSPDLGSITGSSGVIEEEALEHVSEADDMSDFIVDDLTEEPETFAQRPRALVAVKEQSVFQPSSSPMQNHRRYMAWNMIGVVVQREVDGRSLIDIEFHDVTSKRNIHFTDHYGFTMAALGENGAVFACPGDLDSSSCLYYKQFDSWELNEWTNKISASDNIINVAVGSEFCAAATQKRFVHIFSLSGLLVQTLCMPEDIICTSGYNNKLCVVYRAASGAPLKFLLYRFSAKLACEILSRDEIALSTNSTLHWLGFSQIGLIATCDSQFIVRVYNCKSGWVPVVDCKETTEHSETNGYWLVGLTDSYCMTVVLLGGRAHPPVTPRPVITPVALLPTGIQDMESLEAQYFKTRFVNGAFANSDGKYTKITQERIQQMQTQEDTCLLKLIQLACKQDKLMRVLDLASLLNLPKAVSIAIQIAQHDKQQSLAQKLGELQEKNREKLDDSAVERDMQSVYSTLQKSMDEQYNHLRAEQQAQRQSIEDTRVLLSEQRSRLDTFIESALNTPIISSYDTSNFSEPVRKEIPMKANPFKESWSSHVEDALPGENIFDKIHSATSANANKRSHTHKPLQKGGCGKLRNSSLSHFLKPESLTSSVDSSLTEPFLKSTDSEADDLFLSQRKKRGKGRTFIDFDGSGDESFF
ncbi:WD repeat and HMG-box DNA-binding protein 1-like isoform X3 [Zophobas morio]|uniref:WD repeat and HMG-box DNA-binding protein 1-like isoform X3 n=1 Tax=Zophobas morio TaxID=2755281 RepID=UPI003083E5A7